MPTTKATADELRAKLLDQLKREWNEAASTGQNTRAGTLWDCIDIVEDAFAELREGV